MGGWGAAKADLILNGVHMSLCVICRVAHMFHSHILHVITNLFLCLFYSWLNSTPLIKPGL